MRMNAPDGSTQSTTQSTSHNAGARKITAGFLAALAILTVIAVISYRGVDDFLERTRLVEHSYLVINDLEELMSRIKDAESAQRGFLISGEESALVPFTAAALAVPGMLESLKGLTADNPEQQERIAALAPLVGERIKRLERGINFKRSSATVLDIGASLDEGARLMDAIRVQVAGIIDTEQSLLSSRSTAAMARAGQMKWTIALGSAVALAMLALGFLLLRAQLDQRARAERAAQIQANELADLYDNAPVGYHSVDDNGIFVRINNTWLNWLGYSRDELIGKKRHSDIMTPASAERHRREARPMFDVQGYVRDFEMEYVRKDGGTFPASVSGTVIRDEQGRYVASRTTVFDITRRKRLEIETLKLNEALKRRSSELEATNKELESFSYSVSHDLRSPLRAIDGFSLMLEEDYNERLDDEGRRMLRVVRDNAAQMARLIDDLLAFSRLGRKPVASAAIDMTGLAREALTEVLQGMDSAARGVALEELPPGIGDRALLRQVWINLIGNAVKYSGKQPEPNIRISGRTEGNERVYCVTDNGVGFDMRYYDKLFGVFQRLHAASDFQGTGVGLAIVQRIVTRHGGRAWAEGKLGEGASFFFALPVEAVDTSDDGTRDEGETASTAKHATATGTKTDITSASNEVEKTAMEN
jgi:PAS domain S-box-containing protein